MIFVKSQKKGIGKIEIFKHEIEASNYSYTVFDSS